jgi:hypothetical protein
MLLSDVMVGSGGDWAVFLDDAGFSNINASSGSGGGGVGCDEAASERFCCKWRPNS